MPYTEKRGSTYWFRRRAPAPLIRGNFVFLDGQQALVGQSGYVRFSLQTRDYREAGKLARKYSHLLDQAAERLADAQKLAESPPARPPAPAEPTPEEIKFAADAMYAQLLAADEQTLKRSFDAALAARTDVREPDRFLWSSADLPPPTLAGQIELLKMLRAVVPLHLYMSTGKTPGAITADYLPFADAFRRYVAALERRRAAEIVPTPTMPTPEPIWSWDAAFDYYVRQRPTLAESSVSNYKLAWNGLKDSSKRQTPGKITLEDVVKWRDEMLGELALHQQTAKNRLTAAGAIWRDSRANGKIPRGVFDPFEGVHVRINAKTGSSRKAYTAEELQLIFKAPPVATKTAVSVHAGYWLPLLALYHGARLDELTGLEVRDVEDWKGGVIMHIRENTVRPRLKGRTTSERSIPVHPKLLELGFTEYVQAARAANIEKLFPSFSRSATFGETYVDHVKAILKPSSEVLVGMHNFRHNWETARRTAKMDTSVSNYIGGRRIDAGSAALYGGPAGIETLAEELAKIAYPVEFQSAPPVNATELRAQDARCKAALRAKKTAK